MRSVNADAQQWEGVMFSSWCAWRQTSKDNKPASLKPGQSRFSQSRNINYNQDSKTDRWCPQAFIRFKHFPLEATNLSWACQHSDTILSNETLMCWSEHTASVSVLEIWGLIKRFLHQVQCIPHKISGNHHTYLHNKNTNRAELLRTTGAMTKQSK